MKLFLSSSSAFYDALEPIEADLITFGHSVTRPVGYRDDFAAISESENQTPNDIAAMLMEQISRIEQSDGIVVVNLEKNGIPNYVGASVFLEMYEAFKQEKPVYMWNPIPENMLKDEISAFKPRILNQDVSVI